MGVLAEDVVEMRVELESVLLEVLHEVLGTEHLGDDDELVVVVLSLEEGLLLEDHGGEHGSGAPDVERVVVVDVVDEQLGPLEVARGDAHVVVLPRVVELGQAPVDELQDALLGIDNDVLGLHVAVHDAS